jgi:hypothetical protein
VHRALNRFMEAPARQVALWERYLVAQRRWQGESTPLQWRRTVRGWRLIGTVLPEIHPHSGRRPVGH